MWNYACPQVSEVLAEHAVLLQARGRHNIEDLECLREYSRARVKLENDYAQVISKCIALY
jgi:hypothetical protein